MCVCVSYLILLIFSPRPFDLNLYWEERIIWIIRVRTDRSRGIANVFYICFILAVKIAQRDFESFLGGIVVLRSPQKFAIYIQVHLYIIYMWAKPPCGRDNAVVTILVDHAQPEKRLTKTLVKKIHLSPSMLSPTFWDTHRWRSRQIGAISAHVAHSLTTTTNTPSSRYDDGDHHHRHIIVI